MKSQFLTALNKNTPAVKAYNKAVLRGRHVTPSDSTLSTDDVDLEKIRRVFAVQGKAFKNTSSRRGKRSASTKNKTVKS